MIKSGTYDIILEKPIDNKTAYYYSGKIVVKNMEILNLNIDLWVKIIDPIISKLVLVQPQYDYAGDFFEGYAKVKIGEKYGYIDKTGKLIIKPKFDDARNFSEGLAFVKYNGKYGFINKSGDWIIQPKFDWEESDFKEGLVGVSYNDKWSYIDKTGNWIISPIYKAGNQFSDGLASVYNGSKYGYIDKTGKVIISFKYWYAGDFIAGIANVSYLQEKPNSGTYINKSGNEIFSNKFYGEIAYMELNHLEKTELL